MRRSPGSLVPRMRITWASVAPTVAQPPPLAFRKIQCHGWPGSTIWESAGGGGAAPVSAFLAGVSGAPYLLAVWHVWPGSREASGWLISAPGLGFANKVKAGW